MPIPISNHTEKSRPGSKVSHLLIGSFVYRLPLTNLLACMGAAGALPAGVKYLVCSLLDAIGQLVTLLDVFDIFGS